MAKLNRTRRVPFLLDDADFWDDFEHLTFQGAIPRERVLEALRSPMYAGRNPRVWDRAAADFVPVV